MILGNLSKKNQIKKKREDLLRKILIKKNQEDHLMKNKKLGGLLRRNLIVIKD